MRAKLAIILPVICLLCALVFSCAKQAKSGDVDGFGYCLSLKAVLAPSPAEIERTLHCSQTKFLKREARAGNAQFLFYVIYPYHGYLIDGIYCYERVIDKTDNHDYWILRGYFPINYSQFSQLVKKHPELAFVENHPDVITYVVHGDSVELQIFGVELFSIKSIEGVLKEGQKQ